MVDVNAGDTLEAFLKEKDSKNKLNTCKTVFFTRWMDGGKINK